MTTHRHDRVLAIVGPTAAGKTALAVRVAHAVQSSAQWTDAEVIGTDSMQAYQGMRIGTAAPTLAEREGVAHHMLEVWPAGYDVSVAEFQEHARRAIDGVLGRGALPIVVGGSGLYVSAVLDDLRFPGTDPVVRRRLEDELEQAGSSAMHQRLATVDPAAAAAILPTNGRRIVRALEVIELTGAPFVARLPDPVDVYDTVRVGLDIPRDVLDARIAARVDRMWADGFADEVIELQHTGLGRTAARALGYPQMIEQLSGSVDEEHAKAATVAATAKFARRQQRWFRRDQRIVWVDYDADDAAERCLAALGSATST